MEKINIIAHSKVGLDSRYAVSVLGRSNRIISLTLIDTSHHGSQTIDKLINFPKFPIRILYFCVNFFFKVLGNIMPRTCEEISSFTMYATQKFNEQTSNCDNVYYQSCIFVVKKQLVIFLCGYLILL